MLGLLSPSGEPRRAAGGLPPALIVLTAILFTLRLIVAAHVHLTEDEAYYRLWSMTPALGYYDHPPMIAWWIWVGRRLVGETALGVRLLPIVATAVTGFLVFDLARVVGAERRAALRAGIWFNAMLLPLAGGILAVPDAPTSLFWTVTLICALRAERANKRRWWIAAGVAAGLAVLSKYSALFLGPGLLAWLLIVPRARVQLAMPGPWIACLTAAALIGLNLTWNADHEWLTFHKQFGRIAVHRFAPRYVVELIAGQAVLMNPLIVVFLGMALVKPKSETLAPVSLAPLFAASAPFVAYLVFHSLHDRVEAHWPTPLYPALAVCAAVAAERMTERASWRGLAAAVPVLGWSVLAVGALVAATPVGPMIGSPDLAAPIRGWPQFAKDLDARRRSAGAAWVGTVSYGLAAELADERDLAAPVAQLDERDRWRTLRVGAPPDMSKPGIVVDLPRRVTIENLRLCFRRVDELGTIIRKTTNGSGVIYAEFRVADPLRNIMREGC